MPLILYEKYYTVNPALGLRVWADNERLRIFNEKSISQVKSGVNAPKRCLDTSKEPAYKGGFSMFLSGYFSLDYV